MTATIPSFGIIGTAGIESHEKGGGVDLLELQDGAAIQQYRRMARPNENIQKVTLTAWGITPQESPFAIYPDSVTLSAQEEAAQHEVARIAAPTRTENATKYDGIIVFRARCSMSVQGRCKSDGATGFDDPFAVAWPQSWVSALGGLTISPSASLSSCNGMNGTLILTNATIQKIAADWHSFSYEYSWIRALSSITGGPTTPTHVIPAAAFPAGISAPSGGEYLANLQFTLTGENFANSGMSFEVLPIS